MLEKNKDYVEFTLQCTTVERTRDKDYREVCFNGYSDYDFPGVPMDVVCKDFNHKVVMISKRDFDQLQTENEQLKKKLSEFDFMGWMESAKLWKERYNDLSKLVGFSSEQEIEDYLVNEAECDTLHEAISKLKDQVKYTCDEWYSANSTNNSWKAAAECNSPKELIEKREAIEKEIQVYSRALQEWKEITGYPSPSAVKTALESGASWCHAYNEIKKANEKLADDVKSWKNVTGYSTPESFLAAKINDLGNDCLSWKMVTGCSCPKDLSKKIVEWEKTFTPRISARDLCSAMSNAIESYKHKFEPWQKATGCKTPEEAEATIRNLRGRIDEMKEFAAIASNWTDRIVED